MLRCCRGSAAFATVIALVPLIGAVALGAEAGSWYVTKQHAQNAADAAAYSGALRLACSIAVQTGVACTDTQTVDYRGKEFAAQNAFCNAGDTSYPGSTCATSLPSGTSQTVQIAVLTSWNGSSGNFVQATVSQQQRAYLAAVLGLSTVNIGATAIAEVDAVKKPPCVLALKDSLSFQGSPTVSSPNCGIASDSSNTNAISFTGNNGINLNAPSYTVGGCSQTGGSQCTNVHTYADFIPDPLSGLNAAISSLKTSDFPDGACPAPSTTTPLPAYGAPKQCYYDGFSFQNNQTYTLNGVYFFADGQINIQGNTTITGTATLILLPPKFVNSSDKGASLNVTGNPTIQLTAPSSVLSTQVPAPLASSTVTKLMTDLLIYDPEAWSKQGVNITGSSSSYFNGTVYVPNTPVTYSGNSSASAPNPGCYQIIAYAVTFSGNTNLDDSKCISDGAITLQVQTVRLVQ
jgi:hypothetical protein